MKGTWKLIGLVVWYLQLYKYDVEEINFQKQVKCRIL